jgi:hypothetical protein
MPPTFSSFAEAWRWFLDGGELIPLAEQRERFTRGRAQFLSFEAPLAGSPVADEAAALQDELAGIAELAPWPLDLLHISLRGVGWQVIEKSRPDEVLRQEVGSIAERSARSLRGLGPLGIVVGPVNVFPDALILEVHEASGLVEAAARGGGGRGRAWPLGGDIPATCHDRDVPGTRRCPGIAADAVAVAGAPAGAGRATPAGAGPLLVHWPRPGGRPGT